MLVRGKYLIADASRPGGVIEDGAIRIDNNKISAVGKYDQLRRQRYGEYELGSEQFLVLPGLINAHEHGLGVSAFQLGLADDFLELWILRHLGLREVDPYLTTMRFCAKMIESGVTTVAHNYYNPDPARYSTDLQDILRAYNDAGMRACVILQTQDKSPITGLCERLQPTLPSDLKTQVSSFLRDRRSLSPEAFFALFETWREKCGEELANRVRIMIGPVSVHWCSDPLLTRIWERASSSETAVQAHALESILQRQEAISRYGKTAVEHLAEIGFLGPRLSCAHCVWVNERDIALLARTHTSVVHNASSNLRLHSGIAPVVPMLNEGVNVALGMDSLSLNDDGDMFQEMRLVASLHRSPGIGSGYPTAAQVFQMATKNGAQALAMDSELGTLEEGKTADLVLVHLDRILHPFVDPHQDTLDTLLLRAKAQDVATVIINGRVVMEERRLTTIDKKATDDKLKSQLAGERHPVEEELAHLAACLQPYAETLYRAQMPGASLLSSA